MYASKKAESFVGIVVWIFILSIVILWILNVLIFSNEITRKYEETNEIDILRSNLINIVKKTDTSWIRENEIFFIHKNRAAQQFEIYTGSTNEHFKYIDRDGNTVNPDIYMGDVFTQILWLSTEDTSLWSQNQVIRASIKKLVRN